MRKQLIRGISVIGVLCLVFGLIIFLSKIQKVTKQNFQAFDEDLPSSYILTSDDSILMSENIKSKLKVNEVRNNKIRQAVSFLIFDSLYWMITYKIDLKGDIPLATVLLEERKSVDRSVGYTYKVMDNGQYYSFQYKSGPTKPVSQVVFTIAADSLALVKRNDTVLAYHGLCDNLSISYNEGGPIDLFLTGSETGFGATRKVPLDVLFLKQKKSLYFFLMAPLDYTSSTPPELLYNIIVKN